MGLATVLGVARRGFFIPHRYAGSLPTNGERGGYGALNRYFDDRRPQFAELVAEIERLAPALEAITDDGAAPRPRWLQGWFPRLDAAVAYTLVRRLAPRRIVEIGSGHSTRFMARAVADAGLATRITTIDPAPRAALFGPDGNGTAVEHLACALHQVEDDLFAELAPGDILFIDSSHILMPGTDVDFLLNRVWPALAGGVVVHFHDIFLPADYPASWGWRGYNEQLGVAPLIASGAADILFASHYVATRMPEALSNGVLARLPMMAGAIESSLWLEKRAPTRPSETP